MNRPTKLYHGACYYPELWEEHVEQDIALMLKAGLNMVRIGEFWWSRIEPNEGEYDMGFITSLLDRLHESGLDVVLCTPTPTPPIWLSHNHPQRMHVDAEGRRMTHGSRQHVCTNNADMRRYSYAIIEEIAKAVAKHPAVVLWQLDNEFKCHVHECYCDSCKAQFHEWLKQKYGTIEGLNKAWGAMIWSQLYQSFEQVPLPSLHAPFLHNASLITNFKLFHREKIAEFAKEQADIIRKYSDAPITTNAAMGFGVNNEALFEHLDCVAYDTYASQADYHRFMMNIDRWRCIKKDTPFWLLETTCSHTGALDRMGPTLPGGYLACEALACYAAGAAGFAYWLWRQQRSGCEINHAAVISAWGKPSVGYKDVLLVDSMRKKLEPMLLSTKPSPARAAITYSDMAEVFMSTENHGQNDYNALFTSLYGNMLKAGIHRDVIPENATLDGYRLLLTPFMLHISDDYVARAQDFVNNGGIWIVGPMTGGRTADHGITTDSALGAGLERLAGVEVLHTYSMDNTGAVGAAFGHKAPLGLWGAAFGLRGATTMGHIIGGESGGLPFITEHTIGKGKIIMVGAMPMGDEGGHLWQALMLHYAKQAGITPAPITEGTITIPRHDEQNEYLIVINMDGRGNRPFGYHVQKLKP